MLIIRRIWGGWDGRRDQVLDAGEVQDGQGNNGWDNGVNDDNDDNHDNDDNDDYTNHVHDAKGLLELLDGRVRKGIKNILLLGHDCSLRDLSWK